MSTTRATETIASTAGRLLPLAVLILLLAVGAPWQAPGPAAAADTISLLYIDMDTTGNTINAPWDWDGDTVPDTELTSLGPVDECVSIASMETWYVDIVVADWPDSGEQLVGFDITLNYDPAVVQVVAAEFGFSPLGSLIVADPQSGGVGNFGESVFPDSDGAFWLSVMDITGPFDPDENLDGEETSPGFLARIELQGVAQGQSTLTLSTSGALILTEEALGSYVPVDQVNQGFVNVDQACPTPPFPQPGPTPPPLPPSFCSGGPDSDDDGFSDCIETFVGTDPAKDCAATGTANDEGLPDRWPVDADDNQFVILSDMLLLILLHVSDYDVRSDLNTDEAGNLLDALPIKTHFADTCTPSAAATIVVDSTADTNTRDSVLTLREAILLATGGLALGSLTVGEADNVTGTPGAASPDTIIFDDVTFPPGDPQTITLTSALPALSTDIDAVDGSGAGVIVDGAASYLCFNISSDANTVKGINLITNCTDGVLITGAGNTIGGTDVGDRNVISGNTGDGVEINGAGATSNVIKGNYIGTNTAGSAALGNSANGLFISAAPGNTIGGTAAGAGNVISGNSLTGVSMMVGGGSNRVEGNYIGTDVTGTVDLGNSEYGLYIDAVPSNTIGGTTAGAGNVISGNDMDGIYIVLASATGNTVQGNYIGTNASGTADLGNTSDGLSIDRAPNTTIGGTVAAARNIISGNDDHGVHITGSSATGNHVRGNHIGTNAAGAGAVANAGYGVLIDGGAQSNVIGGTTAGERNVISGNDSDGVWISDNNTDWNVVEGNYIGTDSSGAAPLGNGTLDPFASGVAISNGAQWNVVGGESAGERNVISANRWGGIGIGGASDNSIIGNYVGTDLTGMNDVGNVERGMGINGAGADLDAQRNEIRDNVISGNGTNGIDLYGANTTDNTVAGNLIGLDATGAVILANGGSGVWFGGSAHHNTIGGDSADERNVISGNTNFGVYIYDSGTDDNTVSGNYIGSNAAGTGALGNSTGVQIDTGARSNTIGGTTSGKRNVISGNSFAGVRISDGGTDGNFVKGNYIGLDAGGDAALQNDAFGVYIAAGAQGNTIGGATAGERNVISGNSDEGILIIGTDTDLNTVRGNYIGTNASGSAAIPNFTGVFIYDGAQSNTIGGTTAGERNVISGNTSAGIVITGSGTTGNTVSANHIGTNPAGTGAIANNEGVKIEAGAQSNTIGGATASECNVISGNSSYGIRITGTGTDNNTVKGNHVGTDAAGTADLGNGSNGVTIDDADSNTIGGTAEEARNVISGNGGKGVEILNGGTLNEIQGNYIGIKANGTEPLGNDMNGVRIENSPGNTVGGTAAGAGNVISGNTGNGVEIQYGGATGNMVQGNLIGTNAAGDAAVPNGGSGVSFSHNAPLNPQLNTIGGSTGTTPGGPCTGACNVISGNTGGGVEITSDPNGNYVKGNYIGVNRAGTAAIPNNVGVAMGDGASDNTIGGTTAEERNVISGNDGDGVYLVQSGTSGNTVSGNYIGTNVTGDAALPNNGRGVHLTGGASGNVIGGTTAGERNVISGNNLSGVLMHEPGTDGNTVSGNYIGTNAAGDGAVPNALVGVNLRDGAGTVIGGTTAGERNVISGNGGTGVDIADAGTGNLVQGNFIGTDAAGTGDLGNVGHGVFLTRVSGTIIGGTTAGEGNTIAFNDYSGVCVGGADPYPGNSIRGNSIHSNDMLGIDLVPSGESCVTGTPTPNDAGDGDTGPNNLMNFPVITSAAYDGVTTVIAGTLDDTPNPENDIVDVYATDAPDVPSFHGEGRAYLGSTTPDVAGDWLLVVSGFPAFGTFTATATDPGGSTSEFSVAVTPSPGPGLPLVTIAQEGQTAPAPVNGTFATFGPPRAPDTTGDAVFWASASGGDRSEGIFLRSGGLPTTLVAAGDGAPAEIGGTFSQLGRTPIMNESGDVAFWAEVDLGGEVTTEGIFLYSSGDVSVVAAVDDPTPSEDSFASFSDLHSPAVPVINTPGDVAFWAHTSSGQGIFLFSQGEITEIALTGQEAPETDGGTFSTFVAFGGWPTVPIVTNNRQVSFWGAVTGGSTGQGIFLSTQGIVNKVVLAGEGTPVDGSYVSFGQIPSPNDSGEVAFWATIGGLSAPACPVYGLPCAVFKVSGGTVDKIVLSGETGPPGVGGTIARPGTVPLINDSGQVTFWADITNGFCDGFPSCQALVRFTSGLMENVAAVGNDTLITPPPAGVFSDFVDAQGVPTVPMPNNLGQVGFWGEVSGGSSTEGVFLAGTTGPVVQMVARAGETAPGGGTFDANFDLDIDDGGGAVYGNTLSGGTSSGIYRFFSGSPEVKEEVVRKDQAAPTDVGGLFSSFGPPVTSNSGYIVSWAETNEGVQGIFRFFTGTATTVQKVTDDAPVPAPPWPSGPYRFFTGFAPDVQMNNNDEAVARVTTDTEPPDPPDEKQALYRFFTGSPGDPTLLAMEDDIAPPDTSRFFTGFGLPAISDGGFVVARVTTDTEPPDPPEEKQVLYRFYAGAYVGDADRFAQQGDTAPDTDPPLTYTGFGDRPGISPDGKVAYKASVIEGVEEKEALFVYYPNWSPPTIALLAKEGDPAPGGGTFTGFGNPVINRYAQVVARTDITDVSEKEGLTLFIKSEPTSIVQTEVIALEGETAPDATFAYGSENPSDDVFPYYAYSDTARVVYVANLVLLAAGGGSQAVYIASLDNDGDGVLDFLDNCPDVINTAQYNTDRAEEGSVPGVVGDDLGNACDDDDDGDGLDDDDDLCPVDPDCDNDGLLDSDDPDDDNDTITDTDESACDSDPINANSVPERLGNSIDDDGDVSVDEVQAPVAGSDCDGDGFKDDVEAGLTWPPSGTAPPDETPGAGQCDDVSDDDGDTIVNDGCPNAGDVGSGGGATSHQARCADNGTKNNEDDDQWPADFNDDGTLNLIDVNSFVAPIRHYGQPIANHKRWDLTGAGTTINLQDVNLLGTLKPPMLYNTRAYGQSCPAD